MNIPDKIRTIRNKLGLTQDYLAYKVGYTSSHIGKLENGSRTMTDEILEKIKKALGIADVPLTPGEIKAFEQELYNWRDLINAWCLGEAGEIREDLKRRAELSQDQDLRVLYLLICIGFFRAVGDNHSADDVMAEIEAMGDELTAEHKLRLLIVKGTDKAYAHNYKEALSDLLTAELINDELKIANAGLYHNIAICLTDLGYAHRACDYIAKVRSFGKETEMLEIHCNMMQAINYGNIERYEEAIDLLKSCMFLQKSRPSQAPVMASICNGFGYVYMKAEDYAKALENFNKALEHIEEGSWDYLHTLYYMSQSLYKSGDVDASDDLLNKGIALASENDVTSIMFNAAKHLRNLDNDLSLAYIENTAIPGIKKFGRYIWIIEYCNKLKDFYKGRRKYRVALKYSEMANDYHKNIIEGRDLRGKT